MIPERAGLGQLIFLARVTTPGPISGETLLRQKPLLAAVGAACSALLLATPLSASATPKVPTPSLVSDELALPFNIAFKGRGAYVADGGLNQVVRSRDGPLKTIVVQGVRHVGSGISKHGRIGYPP